jgi:hypothetical protein
VRERVRGGREREGDECVLVGRGKGWQSEDRAHTYSRCNDRAQPSQAESKRVEANRVGNSIPCARNDEVAADAADAASTAASTTTTTTTTTTDDDDDDDDDDHELRHRDTPEVDIDGK